MKKFIIAVSTMLVLSACDTMPQDMTKAVSTMMALNACDTMPTEMTLAERGACEMNQKMDFFDDCSRTFSKAATNTDVAMSQEYRDCMNP